MKEAIKIVAQVIKDIQTCGEEDGEWTSPQGNGVNWCEALETAESILLLLERALAHNRRSY